MQWFVVENNVADNIEVYNKSLLFLSSTWLMKGESV